jgi:DNA-binding transcriptional ArsR family regulator
MSNTRRWTQIFKLLGNVSRQNIIRLLSDGQERNVSDIATEIKVSFTGTSKHLILLSHFYVLKADGKDGHVFYKINRSMPADIKKGIALFLGRKPN